VFTDIAEFSRRFKSLERSILDNSKRFLYFLFQKNPTPKSILQKNEAQQPSYQHKAQQPSYTKHNNQATNTKHKQKPSYPHQVALSTKS
jgi:hypothetical protein